MRREIGLARLVAGCGLQGSIALQHWWLGGGSLLSPALPAFLSLCDYRRAGAGRRGHPIAHTPGPRGGAAEHCVGSSIVTPAAAGRSAGEGRMHCRRNHLLFCCHPYLSPIASLDLHGCATAAAVLIASSSQEFTSTWVSSEDWCLTAHWQQRFIYTNGRVLNNTGLGFWEAPMDRIRQHACRQDRSGQRIRQ